VTSYVVDENTFHRDQQSVNNMVVGIGSVFISLVYCVIQNAHCQSNSSNNCEEIAQHRTPFDGPLDNNSACCKEFTWTVRRRLLLNRIGMGLWHIPMPIPRVLTMNDPVFLYPQLIKGLIQRTKDEQQLRSLSYAAKEAHDSKDPTKIAHVMNQISEIAFGKGITPQMREDFLIQFGCTGYTEEIIIYLLELCRSRGIVEIGAGNGRWARQLTDRYSQEKQNLKLGSQRIWDFVLAFDDMTNVPLSPKIYHNLTQPSKDFFFTRVRKCSSHIDAVRRIECRGRVLLLVYPPPGPMALETVEAYVNAYPEGNDTVIYVGEGKGGANANDAFFDYFLRGESRPNDRKNRWCLMKVINVHPPLGGKGYERLFVLKRLGKD